MAHPLFSASSRELSAIYLARAQRAQAAEIEGDSTPHLITLAWIDQVVGRAESALAVFSDECKTGSELRLARPSPPNKRDWRVDRRAFVTMLRLPEGWIARSSEIKACGESEVARLACAPALWLAAAQGEPGSPSGVKFLEEAGRGFGIDQPLPGSIATDSQRAPMSALAWCALTGRVAWVRELLARGADPNGAGPSGKTPLHFCAARLGRIPDSGCLELLLAAGADPRARSSSGKTAESCMDSGGRSSAAGALLKAVSACALEAKRIGAMVEVPKPVPDRTRPRL